MTLRESTSSLSRGELVALLAKEREEHLDLKRKYEETKSQLDWLKRQMFGRKSEKQIIDLDRRQLCLGESLERQQEPELPQTPVSAHNRRNKKKPWEGTPEDSGLRFDESQVPVKVIPVPSPELEGENAEDYEVVSEKVTYRLAQRRSAYIVLKYVSKVVKHKSTQELASPTLPPAAIRGGYSDVSFAANAIIDKIRYHQPLYRQHQRLLATGVNVSRGMLTTLVHRSAESLRPIYELLVLSILNSDVLLMDETAVKAGRSSPRNMRKCYFWPIYGDKAEVAFPFFASRAQKAAREVLGNFCGILVTDGYKVYQTFAERTNTIVHAQCWVHARRYFEKILGKEPQLAQKALDYIAQLYRVEREIQEKGLSDVKKLLYRAEHSKPVVDEYFSWLEQCCNEHILLPSSEFTAAVNYSLKREEALRVFLRFPDVPLDTNAVEHVIRYIAVGRRNWLFCSTELGAEYVGILHSLLSTCMLQEVDAYAYLVDVLQRVNTTPEEQMHLLTPRLWKENFAQNPLRSDVDSLSTI
jgi:transposase